MNECPHCGHQNIEGVDVCEECQQPLGDLSLPTPATAVEKGLLRDRVSVLCSRSPLVMPSDASVGDVLRALVERAVGAVVIVEDGKVAGIFSEHDALMRLGVEAQKMAQRPIREFMTPNPQTLLETAKIAFAVQRMDQGGYRHIPIVDADGNPIAIVSVRDILRYLTEKILVADAV